jgi:hypothetical protein
MRNNLRALLRRPWLLALGVGLLSTGLAGLVSAHGGDSTLVHGCVNQGATPRGQLTVYSLAGQTGPTNGLMGPSGVCGTLGQPLDWSGVAVAGVSGAAGPVGPIGVTGAPGAVGATGPTGPIANSVIGGTISNPNPTQFTSSYGGLFGIDRTDTDVQGLAMPSAGTVKNLQVKLEGAPGGTASYRVIVLKNGATPSPTLQCLLSASATTCADADPSHAITYAAGDTISISMSNDSTTPANATPMHWAVTFVPS